MFRFFRRFLRPSCRIPARLVRKTPSVVILASGIAQRWTGAKDQLLEHKQLAPVDGEKLLLRTLRQVAQHWDSRPTVITHHKEIAKVVAHRADVLEIASAKRRWIAETALSSQIAWGDPTLILAGDVYWTDAAIRHACQLNSGGPVRFLVTETSQGEDILGIWFRRHHRNRVAKALKHAVRHAELGREAKLWHTYRSLCGFSLFRHRLEKIHCVRIEDESTDFDTQKDYLEFVEKSTTKAA